MKKGSVSAAAYKDEAKASADYIQRQAARLADIARNLSVSGDFSPCTIDAMRAVQAEMGALQTTLKHMVGVSVARGCTHYEEQKAKLVEGTLRLNRRAEIDQAAE